MHDKQIFILKRLSKGGFCSGEALGEQLSISRAAVGKHVKALRELGIDIYSVPGRGYTLAKPIKLLCDGDIAARMRQFSTNLPVPLVFDTIDSTNQYLLERLNLNSHTEQASLEPGQACLAEMQTSGRGRRGRQWASPFAANLYFSLYWQLQSGLQGAMGLSLVVGVVVAETLSNLGVGDVQLKWPNDIYVAGKKLGGILVELVGQVGDACDLVVGVGLNVSMPEDAAKQIDQPWTDLSTVISKPVDRNVLAADLLVALEQALVEFDGRGFGQFHRRWQDFDLYMDKPVTLAMGDKRITGICRGVDSVGALLVEQNGRITPYMGGEISVRGRT
ncbi:bifunctional biotin--[acetyl-CoA-carboxylase] ligase/biotin operon repressor BirA [Corallincola platygyrae]|uniref:Bifunctional ligase/repressor BirA n=1 Tax=Corallincola platygyrae TaxID=1193278 RepID=A0ABW4XPM3_9GAMM